jgi:drug/metabolite transporter (DMT)-like permease
MFSSRVGEFAALATACLWTVNAVIAESASRKVGSLSVTFIRLALGFIFISALNLLERGLLLPTDATLHSWIWLSLSGIMGLSVADLCIFRAFVEIGARIAMLIMALVPPMTALIGWFVMRETLTGLDLMGMLLTVLGVALVVFVKRQNTETFRSRNIILGVFLAFGGAVSQAIGLVLGKYGMGSYYFFAATQIRVIAGIIGLSIFASFIGWWPRIFRALTYRNAMIQTSCGAFFGLFLGVSFSLLAVQNTQTGVASAIMALVPVLIIPPSIIFKKDRVTYREVLGAIIAVAGSTILFL